MSKVSLANETGQFISFILFSKNLLGQAQKETDERKFYIREHSN